MTAGSGKTVVLIAPSSSGGVLSPGLTTIDNVPAGWRARSTTAQPYLLNDTPTVFMASCSGGNVLLSYTRPQAGVFPPFQTVTVGSGCTTALLVPMAVIARVAPVSAAYDMVRIAYPALRTTSPVRVGVDVITVKAPRDKSTPFATGDVVSFDASFDPSTGKQLSVLDVDFIQPDGFEYFARYNSGTPYHSAVLPDLSALTWTEGGSANTGGTVGMKASASYVITGGPPVATATDSYTGPLPLAADAAGNRVFYPNSDGLVTTSVQAIGDFVDGNATYDAASSTFRFFAPFAQTQLNGTGTGATQFKGMGYAIAQVPEPKPRFRWLIRLNSKLISASQNVYSLKVQVPSRARIRFAGMTADGKWKRLHTLDCENDDDTSTTDGDGAGDAGLYTRTCLVRAPGVVKLGVLTRDVLIPADVDLPPANVEGIDGFFSTFDQCAVPTKGSPVECFNDGTPRACQDLRGTCTTADDCCGNLTCQGGSCAAPACHPTRGACSRDTECCSGLTCQDGACNAPVASTCHDAGACATDEDCCDAFECWYGSCRRTPQPTCIPQDTPCIVSTDCCADLTCTAGACEPPVVCQPTGGRCATAGDCCAGSCSSGGQCSAP